MQDKLSLKKEFRNRTIFRIANYIFLGLVMISMVIPILKIVSDSLDSSATYGMSIIPKHLTFSAYKVIFTSESLYRPFLVSIYTTVVGTAIGLALTTLGAYVLIQDKMPGRKFFVWMVFFTMIFNGGLVPTYLVIKNIGLLNTLWSVILPLSLNVFNMILMKSFFQQIPESLFESAEIDGCSPMAIFIKIVLPLSKPAIASIGLFFAVEYWNHFFNFIMYITDSTKFNFQIKLRELVLDSTGLAAATSTSQTVSTSAIQNASIVVAMLPFLIIYPFCQKYFVTGITMGAVKE